MHIPPKKHMVQNCLVVEPTHLKHMRKSNWKSSPNRDENKPDFKPPDRKYVGQKKPLIIYDHKEANVAG